MQNDLQILIAELQQEQDLLENELNKCLQDTDYKGASLYQKALGYTKEKLQILRNLENPNYNKIMNLKGMINRMENLDIASDVYHIVKIVNDKQIPVYEDMLKQLQRKEFKYQLDSDEIALCLENLLKHKIEFLTIELPRTPVTLSVSLRSTALHIELLGMDSEPMDKHLTYRGLTELKSMRFEFRNGNAVKIFDNFTESDIPSVLQVLSRIAFDVFGLYGDKMAVLHIR